MTWNSLEHTIVCWGHTRPPETALLGRLKQKMWLAHMQNVYIRDSYLKTLW